MDIKDQVVKTAEKIAKDKKLQEQFMKDPKKAVKSVLGVDIPDEVMDKVIAAVKTKLAGDKLSDGLDLVKKLF